MVKTDKGAAFDFPAVVYKVQTLVDNGIRVTLDLPETAIRQAALLMECQREGIALIVVIKGEKHDE